MAVGHHRADAGGAGVGGRSGEPAALGAMFDMQRAVEDLPTRLSAVAPARMARRRPRQRRAGARAGTRRQSARARRCAPSRRSCASGSTSRPSQQAEVANALQGAWPATSQRRRASAWRADARGAAATTREFWPGYVDVLSTLLLVVTFLMSIFMLAQYFASQEASGKDTALQRLTRQISELTNLLSLEKGKAQVVGGRARRAAGDAVDARGGERKAVRLRGLGRREGEGGGGPHLGSSRPSSRRRRTSPTRRSPRSICSISSCWRCAARSRR